MRVISGTARGRRLKEPAGFKIRRTSDKVKEAIFNIVQFDIEGRRVLDMFAGTGQFGIEAMSRGARSVDFVDIRPESVKLIRENLKICGFQDYASVYARDALRFIEGIGKYDLIFMDPPFDAGLADKTLTKIIEIDKLNTNGIIICELDAASTIPAASPPYLMRKDYRYGGVRIVRYDRIALEASAQDNDPDGV